jgi:hypothetical protein
MSLNAGSPCRTGLQFELNAQFGTDLPSLAMPTNGTGRVDRAARPDYKPALPDPSPAAPR